MDGSLVFARLRQCAPHLIHAYLGQPESITQTASRSVQQFLHNSWQSVVGHVLFPKNCRFAWSDLDPYLMHGSLGPLKSLVQTASRSVQPFLHSSRQSVPILYNGPPCPLKIVHSHGGSVPPSNTILWAHPSPQPKRRSDLFSRFLHRSRQNGRILNNGPPPPRNSSFPCGIWDIIHDSFGPPESTTQTLRLSVQPLLQGSRL